MRRATTRLLWPVILLATSAAGPATQPAAADAPADPQADVVVPPEFDVVGQAAAAAAKRAADPLASVVDGMAGATAGLTDLHTDRPVQDQQRAATSGLDVYIKQLEAECKAGSGGNPNPTKPLSKSQITQGPGGSGPLHDAAGGAKAWAALPAKDREQITQTQTEGFPAGYEQVLAGYYSRLSAEQVAAGDNGGAAAGPTTRPTP